MNTRSRQARRADEIDEDVRTERVPLESPSKVLERGLADITHDRESVESIRRNEAVDSKLLPVGSASQTSRNTMRSKSSRVRQAEYEVQKRLVALEKEHLRKKFELKYQEMEQEMELEMKLLKKRIAVDLARADGEKKIVKCLPEQRKGSNSTVMVDKRQKKHGGENNLSQGDREEDTVLAERVKPFIQKVSWEIERPISPIEEASVPRTRSYDRGMKHLMDGTAFEKIATNRPPVLHAQDLPQFNGNVCDWLYFKVAYEDSTKLYKYSKAENMARLRTCLTGTAKETVALLLSTACDPELIINALDQCYGQPQIIIGKALEEIKRCGIDGCEKAQHRLLHRVVHKPQQQPLLVKPSTSNLEAEVVMSTSVTAKDECQAVLLGKVVKTHALLDEGSTITIIEEKFALELGVSGSKKPLKIQGVSSQTKDFESQHVKIYVSRYDGGANYTLKARTMRDFDIGSQRISVDNLRYKHLVKLPLQQMIGEAKPQLLIGAGNWHLIVSRKVCSGKKNEPAASLTRLGWILQAPIRSLMEDNERVLHCIKKAAESDVYKETIDERLEAILKQGFAIDALGINNKKRLTSADARAVQLFNTTIEKRERRYYLGLPWKTDNTKFPESYNMAFKRLKSIERKMDQSNEFKKSVTQLENVQTLSSVVPRWHIYTRGGEIQLHVFCDASEQAHASVAYWRIKTDVIDDRFITAKAPVTPIKSQSKQRLELQAALIGARLAVAIREGHRTEPNKIVLWTDSTTVLQWIRNDKARHPPFVADRLTDITGTTDARQWRWVSTRVRANAYVQLFIRKLKDCSGPLSVSDLKESEQTWLREVQGQSFQDETMIIDQYRLPRVRVRLKTQITEVTRNTILLDGCHTLRKGGRNKKPWGAIFTCLSTRDVHNIEIVALKHVTKRTWKTAQALADEFSLSYLWKASRHRKVSLRGDCYGQRTIQFRKPTNEAASQMFF